MTPSAASGSGPNPAATRRELDLALSVVLRRLGGLALFTLCLCVDAQEQELVATQRVEVVGVSPLPGLELPRDRVAANVQTATARDLERSGATDLTQFMSRRLGGVQVNDMQGNPWQTDVNFRGFVASPLLGSAQGLSEYVDGLRMNQPFGDVVSWDLFPMSAIASLGRILFGPVTGGLVETMGWANFFVLTFVAALPGLWLVWHMRERIDAVDETRPPSS